VTAVDEAAVAVLVPSLALLVAPIALVVGCSSYWAHILAAWPSLQT
jgi:hypothetical protein